MTNDLRPYLNMQNSSVPWIREIPAHWNVSRLKNWLRINQAVLSEDTDPDFEFKYLDIGAVGTGRLITQPKKVRFGRSPSRARRVVRRGDTIISTVRTYLKAVWHAETPHPDLIASTGFAVLSPPANASPKYLSFLCQSEEFTDQITAASVGIAYPAIAETKFASFCVPVPPLSEQAAIARFLDHMDRRIQKYIRAKEKLIALLDEYKQALIHQAVTGQIDVRTGEPYPEYKESGIGWLGHVPANWSVGPLKRFAIKRRGAIKAGPFGSQLTADEMMGTDVKVYTQRNVIDRNLAEGSNYVSNEKFEALRPFQVWPGDVLVTSRGTIGRTMLVTDDCERGILHPCLIRVQPDRKHLVAEFIMAVIQDSQLLPKQLMFLSNATTIDVIYSVTLANVVVPVPPLSEQTAIVHFLRNATAKVSGAVAHVRREIETLTEYRTRLIADAVTGKLDVREAAAALPDPDPANAGTSGNNSLALDEATAVA